LMTIGRCAPRATRPNNNNNHKIAFQSKAEPRLCA